MEGELSVIAAPAIAMIGLLCVLGMIVLGLLVAVGRVSPTWLLFGFGLVGIAMFCGLLYRGTSVRSFVADAPGGAPPGRVFPVILLARGGWLRRFLQPATGAYLVVAEDHVQLRYRRPRNEFLLAAAAFQVVELSSQLGMATPRYLGMAGATVCLVLLVWSSVRRRDLQYPWTRVRSVAAGDDRLHVRVEDEEQSDGLLLKIHERSRARVAELFAERTLFHDEDA